MVSYIQCSPKSATKNHIAPIHEALQYNVHTFYGCPSIIMTGPSLNSHLVITYSPETLRSGPLALPNVTISLSYGSHTYKINDFGETFVSRSHFYLSVPCKQLLGQTPIIPINQSLINSCSVEMGFHYLATKNQINFNALYVAGLHNDGHICSDLINRRRRTSGAFLNVSINGCQNPIGTYDSNVGHKKSLPC